MAKVLLVHNGRGGRNLCCRLRRPFGEYGWSPVLLDASRDYPKLPDADIFFCVENTAAWLSDHADKVRGCVIYMPRTAADVQAFDEARLGNGCVDAIVTSSNALADNGFEGYKVLSTPDPVSGLYLQPAGDFPRTSIYPYKFVVYGRYYEGMKYVLDEIPVGDLRI